MTARDQRSTLLRFAEFELDIAAQEIRKGGTRIHIEVQPFQVLLTLLERQGEVVTREELKEALWPDDTFVDFDAGVNRAVSKIRGTLGDSALRPRFIETVPRRGYRFVGQLEPTAPAPILKQGLAVLVAGVAVAGFVVGLFFYHFILTSPEGTLTVSRFSIRPADPISASSSKVSLRMKNTSISPNGRHVAFIGSERGQLWVQDLEQDKARVIQGVQQASSPFWSPESDFILFTSRAQIPHLLQKVPVQGGAATTICEVRNMMDGAVSNDESTVVFSTDALRKLWEVPFRGGTPEPVLSEAETEEILARHFGGPQTPLGMSPTFLPPEAGERVLLFGAGVPGTPSQRMMVFDMVTRRLEVLPPGSDPVFSPTGHLVYGQGRDPANLWALPFALSSLQPEGEPFLIARNGWQPSISQDGTLVYLDWKPKPSRLVWRDRNGVELEHIGAGTSPRISPDGSQVVFHRDDGDLWIYDRDRGRARTATADQAVDIRAVWSPDGKRLAFSSHRAGGLSVWMTVLDRAGEKPEQITSSDELEIVEDWSQNGKFLLLRRSGVLSYLEHDEQTGEWESHEFLGSSHRPNSPVLSPNGRFIAYSSYAAVQAEIYVESFPEGGGQNLVSRNEGRAPRWRRDGKELFYVGGGTASGEPVGLFAVPVSTEGDFSFGTAKRLFDIADHQMGYDVSADGQQIVLSELSEESPETAIRVVLNWYEVFRESEQD